MSTTDRPEDDNPTTEIAPQDEPDTTETAVNHSTDSTQSTYTSHDRPDEHPPMEDTMDTQRPAEPAAAPAWQEPAQRGIRVGTVVWGLVVAAVGVGLVALASGAVFDVELALIVLVGAAGLALLAGSILGGARRRGN